MTNLERTWLRWLATAGVLVLAMPLGRATAQENAAAAPTATQPAEPADAEAMTAVVVKLAGDVRAAEVAAEGQEPQWHPLKVGDRVAAGTLIQTKNRSSVLLQFGDTAIARIGSYTSATVAQFHRTAQTQNVKLDLGYGAVRAGVAEGAFESDMTIETPVATLTKRGTWNFGIEYEAVTGRFRIYLADRGLVEALNQITNERRRLLAGQYLTHLMTRWIETAKFDRQVPILDVFGLTGAETDFNLWNDSGLSVLSGGGGAALDLGDPRKRPRSGQFGFQQRPRLPLRPLAGGLDRPEGNFGTGGAIIPRKF